MDRHRVPRIKDSLKYLKDSGYNVSYAVDIGVHSGTPWLQFSFPKAHYVLIEPDTNHNDTIHKNYKDYSYELINVALGRNYKKAVDINCIHQGKTFKTQSDIVTLDSLDLTPKAISLCKIDVDGYELQVIEGGSNTLPNFDMMIIESQLKDLQHIIFECDHTLDFKLWDVVNLDYANGNLHQVDLVFLKNEYKIKPVPGYLDYQFFRQGSDLQ